MVLVLVAPPLLAADGRRLTRQLSEILPALRVGEDAFLAGAPGWTAGLAGPCGAMPANAGGAWAAGAWLVSAALLEHRDV